MKKSVRQLICIILFGVTACSSQAPVKYSRATITQDIILPEPYTIENFKQGALKINTKAVINPGTYKPLFEDDLGYYFQGPGYDLYVLGGAMKKIPGGFYVSKSLPRTARIYMFMPMPAGSISGYSGKPSIGEEVPPDFFQKYIQF